MSFPKAGIVFSLLVALLLVGCGPPDDPLIVPGKRVGNLVPGTTRMSSVVGPSGYVLPPFDERGVTFTPDGQDGAKVGTITVSTVHYRTKEGLGVGDTSVSVRSAYGAPEVLTVTPMAVKDRPGIYASRALHYPGIRWLVDEDGVVRFVQVMKE